MDESSLMAGAVTPAGTTEPSAPADAFMGALDAAEVVEAEGGGTGAMGVKSS